MITQRRLPYRSINDWLIGFKVANLVVSEGTGRIALLQTFISGLTYAPYDFDAPARCGASKDHAAPAYDCRCGFNAWEEEDHVWRYAGQIDHPPSPYAHASFIRENLIVLRVGLYGHVIQGTYEDPQLWGYKAQRQRVAGLFFATACSDRKCQEPAVLTGIHASNKTKPPCDGYQYLRALCLNHASEAGMRLFPRELSAATGVPVFWQHR
jgi:hypothetical protein